MRKSEQDFVDDLRNQWFADPEFREKWRAYLRANAAANRDYNLARGTIGPRRETIPGAPFLFSRAALTNARRSATASFIRQRQAGRQS
jgi:hypothetical protein